MLIFAVYSGVVLSNLLPDAPPAPTLPTVNGYAMYKIYIYIYIRHNYKNSSEQCVQRLINTLFYITANI